MAEAVSSEPRRGLERSLDRGTWERIAGLVGGLDQRRLLVAIVILAAFPYLAGRPTDIDFWWHLETGELIAATGQVPTTDPFSYTVAGRPWVAHEWLWELVAYLIYTLGGYRLLVLLSALVVAGTALLLYRLARRLGLNEFVAAALVIWAIVLTLPSVGVRPRELTHLFLALYLNRLFLYREGLVRRLWVLPAIMVVWVNVHGPFVLGLVLLGIFVVGELHRWLFGGGKAPRHLLLVSLATLAATVVNPSGPRMLLYPFGYYLQGENPSFRVVTEFQSPNFHDPLYLGFAAALVVFMLLGRAPGRPGLTESLLLVAFAVQALISVRHVPVFALVAVPLLALRLRDRFRIVRELPPPRTSARLVALNWLILAALVGTYAAYAAQPERSARLQLWAEPAAHDSPVEGARFVEEHDLPGPIFNHQSWGGYLIRRWYPERKVFVDGRIDMYGTETLEEYFEVLLVRPRWREVLDEYGVQTILVDRDSSLSVLLLADGGWTRVFQGDREDVFVRR